MLNNNKVSFRHTKGNRMNQTKQNGAKQNKTNQKTIRTQGTIFVFFPDLELPETFLCRTVSIAVKALSNTDKTLQKTSLKNVVKDLEHLANVKSRFSATANCALMYLKTQICILEVQTDQFWNSPSVLCCNCGSLTPDVVEELIVLSYKMDTLFVGLDSEQRGMIREIRLLAHSLLIIYLHRNNSKALQSNSVAVSVWEQLLARIRSQNKLHGSGERNHESLIRTLGSFQDFVESNITKPFVIVDHLQSLVSSCQPPPLALENQLRQASAVINEPQGGSDNPLRFTAGLTLGVDVDADITNVMHTSQVYIQVSYTYSMPSFVHMCKTIRLRLHCAGAK